MDQNWQCCRERKDYFKLILILSVSLLDDMTAFRQFTHDENNWVSPLQKFMFNFSIRLSSYDTFETFFVRWVIKSQIFSIIRGAQLFVKPCNLSP